MARDRERNLTFATRHDYTDGTQGKTQDDDKN